jgi:hypothetical protein
LVSDIFDALLVQRCFLHLHWHYILHNRPYPMHICIVTFALLIFWLLAPYGGITWYLLHFWLDLCHTHSIVTLVLLCFASDLDLARYLSCLYISHHYYTKQRETPCDLTASLWLFLEIVSAYYLVYCDSIPLCSNYFIIALPSTLTLTLQSHYRNHNCTFASFAILSIVLPVAQHPTFHPILIQEGLTKPRIDWHLVCGICGVSVLICSAFLSYFGAHCEGWCSDFPNSYSTLSYSLASHSDLCDDHMPLSDPSPLAIVTNSYWLLLIGADSHW